MREPAGPDTDVDLTPDGVSDEEAAPMGHQTETGGATQVIGAGDVLAADASRAVGRPADVLGVVAADKFFAEREAAQRYHYGRLIRTYGRPRAGRVRVGRSIDLDLDD